MSKMGTMIPLDEEMLDAVSGGTAILGSIMVCVANAPLYISNPVGNHNRSAANTADTVPAGTSVKLFEYGPQYSKIIVNGKVGWVETALLADK